MSQPEHTKPADAEVRGDVDQHEASAQTVVGEGDSPPLRVVEGVDAWEQLAGKVTQLLRESTIDSSWVERLTDMTFRVRKLAGRNPDLALFILIQSNGSGVDHYSEQHAMICLVIAELAANWMEWPEEEKQTLALAALSMNVSMTHLQDTLAKQSTSLTEQQRELVEAHSASSVDLLTKAGVADPVWLHIVQNHHVVLGPDAPDAAKTGPRLTELLRRVDIYTAKLSRRGSRESVTAAKAARDACLDASGHPDSIGATLLRVIGLYPPGTYVELANGETSVVTKRGKKAHTPMVASVRRSDWGLMMPPMQRDTSRMGLEVRKGVEPGRVKVLFDHRRILSGAS